MSEPTVCIPVRVAIALARIAGDHALTLSGFAWALPETKIRVRRYNELADEVLSAISAQVQSEDREAAEVAIAIESRCAS